MKAELRLPFFSLSGVYVRARVCMCACVCVCVAFPTPSRYNTAINLCNYRIWSVSDAEHLTGFTIAAIMARLGAARREQAKDGATYRRGRRGGSQTHPERERETERETGERHMRVSNST